MENNHTGKIRFIPLLISVAIPVIAGTIIGLVTRDSTNVYETAVRPSFAPPSSLFPIVWTILYVLMGISLYIIYTKGGGFAEYSVFAAQLIVNLIWPLVFFHGRAFWTAFAILVVMWLLIFLMIGVYRRVSVLAAVLQIPYLLWVTFAGVLNYSIAINT